MSNCPVDHSPSPSREKCPVDHSKKETNSFWSAFLPSSSSASSNSHSSSFPAPELSKSRTTSSIPKLDSSEGNWVYPSEAQFFSAMARKQHNPQAQDMRSIVPIHNAVNERTWSELLKWENGRGGVSCGGVKLVTFKGRPNEKSPKARMKMFFGYAAPFDRHDWVIDRCGTRIRYVIDFYTGRNEGGSGANNLSFFLDVRPALDNWEGVKMRIGRFLGDWLDK